MGHSSENHCVAEPAEVSHEFSAVYEQFASGDALLEDSVGRLALKLTGERFQRRPDRSEKDKLVARLERVLDTVPVGLVVLDGAGAVLQCNAMAVEYFGSPLLGVQWREVISRVFGTTAPGETARLRDGRLVTTISTPLSVEPAQIILLQDVLEQHSVRKTQYRHRCHVSSMGEMAASLAQQLRQPLTSALLYVAKLERDALSEEERARYMQHVNSSLSHIERTTVPPHARIGRRVERVGDGRKVLALDRRLDGLSEEVSRHAIGKLRRQLEPPATPYTFGREQRPHQIGAAPQTRWHRAGVSPIGGQQLERRRVVGSGAKHQQAQLRL